MIDFTISTTSFENGAILPMEQVLNAHGCTGSNISPDLKWENPPYGTKEYALIVHDPDAPVLNGWYHWIVLNIPLEKTSFKKGEKIMPPMVETGTSFSDIKGYGGACPPIGHGIHHYNFTIYALSKPLDEGVKKLSPVEIERKVKENSIKSATLYAIYQR